MRPLTDRQREVLQAICDTGTEALAAERLGVHMMTVKNTTLRIRRNMGVHSTLQVIYRLMRDDGYIQEGHDEHAPEVE